MPVAPALQLLDWIVIAFYMALTVALGFYFVRRGSKDADSYFVSGRSLPWFLSGISMIATSFASDTPLWITSLVRQNGIYYIWQYWAPAIGSTLAIVLFARLWRRMGVLTDIEFMELRYSGRGAALVRGWNGFSMAILFCPLVIGWVTKAMESITREVMGLPPEYTLYTTILVVSMALLSCTLSGLWGLVFTDLLQFCLATVGTIILACYAVDRVGGLTALVDQLSVLPAWNGSNLAIWPSFGSAPGQVSFWNAVGYFGILWIGVALAGGYQAQRVLACKDSRHASLAMLLHTLVYYACICWPWILVALCSLILLPDLGDGVSNDSAYPRMIIMLLPAGLRGMLVVALLSAFMSTISTMFNWGASYIVNDLYRRFAVPSAPASHYVVIGRIATVLIAIAGAWISFNAENIQQLLTIAFVVGSATTVVGLMRWFWWRLNAAGDLAGALMGWGIAALVLLGVFDAPARALLGSEATLSSDENLLGARMMLVIAVTTLAAIAVTWLTRPTDAAHLRAFVLRARPFHFFWRPVIRQLDTPYYEYESLGHTLISWGISLVCVYALMFGIGKLLLGSALMGMICLIVFVITLVITVRRLNSDFVHEEAMLNLAAHEAEPSTTPIDKEA